MEFIRDVSALDIDLMEIDVRTNHRGELIMAHDESESNPVKLAEAFEFLKGTPHLKMNCDLKTSGLELAVWELACQHEVQDQLVFSGSVGLAVLSKHPWLCRKIGLYLNIEQIIPELYERIRTGSMDQQSLMELLIAAVPVIKKAVTQHNAICLNLHYKLYFPELTMRLKHEGIHVSAWTPNEPDAIESLLKAGVYNITTRRPRIALMMRSKLEE